MMCRERVLVSIGHNEPDRVPLDIGATPSSGISAIAYANLVENLKLSGARTLVYDVVQQVAQPEESVLDLFGADILDVGRAFNNRPEDWRPVTLPTGQEVFWPAWFRSEPVNGRLEVRDEEGDRIATMPAGATFFDQAVFPYLDGYPDDYKDLGHAMSKVLWQKLAHSPWDHAGEPDFWEKLREKAQKMRAESDRAIMIVCGCNLFEWGTFLRRIDNFLMDLIEEPENVEALLDALMEKHLATLEKVCNAVGDVCDILRFGDDLGMNTGPFMSPKTYRALFKPRHTMLCDYVHKHSGMKTFLHSCGSIYRLMPDLIEAGYDVINPVQTVTQDMEPERLKREFGSDITFWGGGMNTRAVLNRGTPTQVYDYARRMIDIFAPGGGFVFNQEHNVMPDVPPENLIAMYRAVAGLPLGGE
jgi:uroporphyrinogen decarboxylase